MPYYSGTWTFMNVMHPDHRRSGTTRVEASSEEEACGKIRRAGSRELFGGGMMTYFEASNVRKDSR